MLHRPASSARAGALVCSLTQMDVLWYTELLASWDVCAAALAGLQHSCVVAVFLLSPLSALVLSEKEAEVSWRALGRGDARGRVKGKDVGQSLV